MWFDTQALDAATLYTDLFPDSAIGSVTRYPAGHP
ncbi:MAG: 3-demethylubiquinone-9 3-methyltransferase, partial [Actinomycetota bacterium]